MYTRPISDISFGYKSILKTVITKGLAPTVKYDACGERIDIKNMTVDHVIPKCRGGKSKTSNFVVMNAHNNFKKGNKPLSFVTDAQKLKRYISQWEFVQLPEFNGKQYAENIAKLAKKLGFKL